jgi:hypothetical protein
MSPVIASKLTSEEQKELANAFVKEFYERFQYTPTVVLHNYRQSDIEIITLNDLSACFDPFLPKMRSKTLELVSNQRYRRIAELRHIFCFIARCMSYTLKDIGIFLNNRDHTTVMHSISVFKNLYETDDLFKQKFNNILNHIKQKHESPIMEHFDKVWSKS